MDDDFQNPPTEQGENAAGGAGSPVAENAAATDPATVIEQVRELLFGEHRRSTETALKSLEDRVAALTATVEARLADVERRLTELKTETDHARDSGVEAIGAAIAELGDKIKNFAARPSS